ncbi:MAG: hypothetical protein RSD18_04885 [Anaerovoracaceae bacterium]
MSKVVDITEKLAFSENPILKIKDAEIEINSDATSVLKIAGLMVKFEEDGAAGLGAIAEAIDLLVGEKDKEALKTLRLSITDLMLFIEAAMGEIMGETPAGE